MHFHDLIMISIVSEISPKILVQPLFTHTHTHTIISTNLFKVFRHSAYKYLTNKKTFNK